MLGTPGVRLQALQLLVADTRSNLADCPLLGACVAWLSTLLEIVAGKRVYSLGKKQCPQLPQPDFMREEVKYDCRNNRFIVEEL